MNNEDDATAGHWEPPADQPVSPQEQPPISWAAPAFGPPPQPPAQQQPPAEAAADSAPTASNASNVFAAPPPAGSFVYPDGAENRYRVDYLESPARRRSPALFIGIGLLVLVLVGVGAGLMSTSTGHSSGAASVASASASPQPRTSTPPSPAPSGEAQAPSAQPPVAGPGPLDNYLLPPSTLGAGTLMALIPGGRNVSDQATLDFCNFNYTSEKQRTERVQVQYLGGNGQSASNEFVRYRGGGAQAAFGEIQQAIAGCPSSYREQGGEVSGIKRLTGLTGLAKDSAAVSFTSTFTGVSGVVRQATTVIYQFDGDYFSGVYVYGADPAAVQGAAATLGAAAAKLLAEAAAGKPGSGGGPLANPQPSAPGIQA